MSAVVQEAEQVTQLRRLRRLARQVLQARKAEQEAKEAVASVRDDMVTLFHTLGLHTVEAVPGESIQLVEPVQRKHDAEAIERYIKRYRPELYDTVFPPVRQLHTGRLRDAIDSGQLPGTVEKYIHDVQGTPQLRRVTR